MYHRYLPTADGQFQRQRVPTPSRPAPSPEPVPAEVSGAVPQEPASPPPGPPPGPAPFPAPAFLRRLFPGMDSGDLLVILILLLLLMEGNEDATPVVMTLAIFLLLQ